MFTNSTQAFYLGIRKALLHEMLGLYGEQSWVSSQLYVDRPSTKIDTLLKLIHHHQKSPGSPPLTVAQEGSNNLVENTSYHAFGHDTSESPQTQNAPSDLDPSNHDRIVVYLAFPMNFWIVEKVCLRHIGTRTYSCSFRIRLSRRPV